MQIDMDEPIEDQAIQLAEEAANFMRGMSMDPRLPTDIKEAVNHRVREMDEALELLNM